MSDRERRDEMDNQWGQPGTQTVPGTPAQTDRPIAPAPGMQEPATTAPVAEAPAAAPEQTDTASPAADGSEQLRQNVIAAISEVYDPEIPVNIYELGLIYDVIVSQNGSVDVAMTLTSPACPVAGTLPGEVETKIYQVDGVNDVHLELVWDPPWHPDMMSEAAKLELGFM